MTEGQVFIEFMMSVLVKAFVNGNVAIKCSTEMLSHTCNIHYNWYGLFFATYINVKVKGIHWHLTYLDSNRQTSVVVQNSCSSNFSFVSTVPDKISGLTQFGFYTKGTKQHRWHFNHRFLD